MPEVQECVLGQNKAEDEKIEKNRTYQREWSRKYRAQNLDKVRQIQKRCHERLWADPNYREKERQRAKKRRQANPEGYKEQKRKYWRRVRGELISHYGGKCICCGETEPKFLALDHIDGNGGIERKNIGYNKLICRIRKNPPKNIQILCHNCNCAKGFYGSCPHQREKSV